MITCLTYFHCFIISVWLLVGLICLGVSLTVWIVNSSQMVLGNWPLLQCWNCLLSGEMWTELSGCEVLFKKSWFQCQLSILIFFTFQSFIPNTNISLIFLMTVDNLPHELRHKSKVSKLCFWWCTNICWGTSNRMKLIEITTNYNRNFRKA